MSTTSISSVLPDQTVEELERIARERGVPRSTLIKVALQDYLARTNLLRAPDLPDIDLESTPRQPEGREPDKEYGERLKALITEVYDFIPPILPRGDTHPVTTYFSKDTLRAMDIHLGRPGVRQKTRTDLIRALVFFGLQAIDKMITDDDPSWRAAQILGRQRLRFERQLAVAEDLYAGARELVNGCYVAIKSGQPQQAVVAWSQYYEDAFGVGVQEREVMLRVLRESPVAQEAAWLGRDTGLVPREMVPEQEPEGWDEEGGIWKGLPPSPKIVERLLRGAQKV